MSARRWLLMAGVVAVLLPQAGAAGAEPPPPPLAISPNPVPANTEVVVSNMPGGECGVGEPVGSFSALVTFTAPDGEIDRIFHLPLEDGNWAIAFDETDQIGRYQVSAICETGVPPHGAVVPPPGVTNRLDFAYQDASFEVVELPPTTETTFVDDTTTTVASSAAAVITATQPTFTG